MAENKTKPTRKSVAAFIDSIDDETKRRDCHAVVKLMKRITNEQPTMWGESIVGFGEYHYKYDSGREGDMLIVGFSPRKQNLTLYIMPGFKRYESLMKRLGKHKTGKSCLYIKRLEDVDVSVLEELIRESYQYMVKKYNP